MTFHQWVDSRGGKAQVASELNVTRQAVYAWLEGLAYPRVDTILKIERLSRKKITVSEVVYQLQAQQRLARQRQMRRNRK